MTCRFGFLTVLAALLVQAGPAPGLTPTHIVTIVCDDLGYGDLGTYGHPFIKTPNLDQLAAEGMKLTSCYAAVPVCSPSRAGFLTGRNPNRYGIPNWIPGGSGIFLPTTEITVATHLKTAGYRTGHFGKWHLNSTMNGTEPLPDDHGFDYWFATQNNASPGHKNPTNFRRNGVAVGALTGFSCQLVASEAIGWLEGLPNKNTLPVYLNVWFHESHEPVESPLSLVAEYLPVAVNNNEAHYFANVANMDIAVGRLLDALDRMGMTQNTLVLFTSDNGPETLLRYGPASDRSYGSPGPLRGMKLHMYEGGYRVPGIIRWPGRTHPGQVVDEPVSGFDVFPTICEIAGLPLPADRGYDGVSFMSLFDGQPIGRAIPQYWQYNNSIGPMDLSIRRGPWKLLSNAGQTSFELYNLDQDLGETQNLAASNPQVLAELVALLNTRNNLVNNDLLNPVNAVPIVSLTAPTDGAQVVAGLDLTLQATASDTDGTVTRVEFFEEWTRLATDAVAPFEATRPNLPPGNYTLTARASDDAGATSISIPVNITAGMVVTIDASNPAAEPATNGAFTVTRTGDVSGPATVRFAVSAMGTATPGDDFVLSPSDAVVFAPGETVKTITVMTLDDTIDEPDEDVVVTLLPDPGYGVDWPSRASLTIQDNDGDPRLVAHWRLDETSRATAYDSAPPPYNGLVFGALMGRTGPIGGAYSFDGLDDYIDTPFAGIGGVGARTIIAWINTAVSASAQPIVAWGEDIATEKWHFRINDIGADGTVGAIRVGVNVGYVIGSTVVTDGAWHMVAVTWADDGTPDIQDAKLYVDGVLQTPSGSASQAVNTNTSATTVQIARRLNAASIDYFQGLMDDVRIYAGELSAAEIQVVYNEGRNQAPTVSITAPADGAGFAVGVDIDLSAAANDPDGAVRQVNFYDGELLIGGGVEAPPGVWTLTWSGATPGIHAVTAVAVDDGAQPQQTTSAAVNVTVGTSVTIQATTSAAGEPGTNGQFTVFRGGDTAAPGTVQFLVDPSSSATVDVDFTLSPVGAVGFAAGETWRTISVLVIDDAVSEPDETVIVRLLDGPDAVVASPASATVTIADDDVSLVAHWKLDETSGTTAFDSAPPPYDGAVFGALLGQTGQIGGAYSFDGVDDYVDTPFGGIAGTAPRTVIAWINTSISAVPQPIVAWGANSASQKWHFRLNENAGNGAVGALRAEVNGGYVIGSTVVSDGTWHMVAVSWENDGSPNILDAKLYVDGVLEPSFSGTNPQSINTNLSTRTVQIGRRQNASFNYYQGLLDDVRIYAGAISAGGILNLYNAGIDQPPQILTGPTATPDPVDIGQNMALTVSATDPDAGPNPLTYTWQLTAGPGNATFSDNGTTTASATTAVFDAAGTYTLQVTVFDGILSATGSVTLTVTDPACVPGDPGDLNRDLVVNILDLNLVLSHFGQTSGSGGWDPLSDPNCDGFVNIIDLNEVLGNFGQTY